MSHYYYIKWLLLATVVLPGSSHGGTNHTGCRAPRTIESAWDASEPTTVYGQPHWPSSFIMFIFKVCSANTKVAWPSLPGVASCCKGDNCCLPAICLPGMVGYATKEQRNRLERLLKGLRRCGFLPANLTSFEALATEADLKLFKSISSNPFHVLRRYLR